MIEEFFYKNVLSLKNGRKVFVETGTAVGETTLWASKNFESVITIEYMDDLYRSCIERFWNNSNIKLIQGDSAKWIELIVYNVQEDAVWFLDAHNVNRTDGILPPEETPVLKEINSIFRSNYDHIVIVDDMRLFGSVDGYPTIEEIIDFCNRKNLLLDLRTDEDMFIVRNK